MRIQQFLEHHGILRNPFAEEDAQTDPVFKDHCIDSTRHPTWDKVYGDPSEPSTSIVFGEKGAGKTALRLQMDRHLAQYNQQHPDQRLFVIQYDDFNPYLDRFRERMSKRRRRPDKMLAEWQLWDHMDAILALGVTQLVDRVLDVPRLGTHAGQPIGPELLGQLDRHQCRDLLLLAACYDQSTAEPFKTRWWRLRRRLRFWPVKANLDLGLGLAASAAIAGGVIYLAAWGPREWIARWWLWTAILLAAWLPRLWRAIRCWRLARGIVRRMRVVPRQVHPLRQLLLNLTPGELAGQPLPNKERTEDRYELLGKLQGVLQRLGHTGIVVLVDRVDEPYLINGSAEMMRALLWPMLDNKFLKHPGMGLKMMLPIELSRFIERESRDFYQRARLDKQNMVPTLQWSGEALFDVANARLAACAENGAAPTLRELFDEAVTEQRLIEALRTLRVPRHMFKFMYRLLVAHCNAHTDHDPVWKISAATFESVLALYARDQNAMELGLGAG